MRVAVSRRLRQTYTATMQEFSYCIPGEGALIVLHGSPMGFGTDIGTLPY